MNEILEYSQKIKPNLLREYRKAKAVTRWYTKFAAGRRVIW